MEASKWRQKNDVMIVNLGVFCLFASDLVINQHNIDPVIYFKSYAVAHHIIILIGKQAKRNNLKKMNTQKRSNQGTVIFFFNFNETQISESARRKRYATDYSPLQERELI